MEGDTEAVVPAHGSNGVPAKVSPPHDVALSHGIEGRVAGHPASLFLEECFDSQEFVAKARRSMPLDDLLAELQAHLLKLRESLVDTINQDYTAFVGMASNLKGLDEALSRVRSPLQSLRTEIDELRAAAAQAVKQLEGKLNERHNILSAHRRLELLLDAEQGLQRMETLLLREVARANAESADGGDRNTSGSDRAGDASRSYEVLERVANEAERLKGQIWRLDDKESAAIKQELLSRIIQLEEQLIKLTNAIFGAAIGYTQEQEQANSGQARNKNPLAGIEMLIQSCWRVYTVSERSDECQAVIRKEAVRPFIAATVTIQALEGGVTGTCNGLEKVSCCYYYSYVFVLILLLLEGV